MIGHLIKLLNALDVCTNDSLLLLEHSDIPVDLSISELLIVEISESSRHLILTLVVEKHMEGAGVVVNLKLRPHWLFYAFQQSANDNDVIDWVSVELAHIVWSGLGQLNHLQSDWSEDFRFLGTIVHRTAVVVASIALVT